MSRMCPKSKTNCSMPSCNQGEPCYYENKTASMADVIEIPTRGFARGAVVRIKGEANNMLVIRGLEATTLVIVCESDHGGDARMREMQTRDLVQILPSAVPNKPLRAQK